MCGASSEQKEMQQKQSEFYDEAIQQSRATFGEQQHIIQQLQDVYAPILQRGPNSRGFSDEQRNDLNATVVEGTAQNYARAARAVNRNIAASGAGPVGPTGAQMQLKAQTANAAAEQQSDEESQVLQADYGQGYNEFLQATNALATASGQLSPATYTNAATSAGTAAADTANKIAEENNSWLNAAIGAAGEIGGEAAGAYCPAEGTLIQMADGKEKPIEKIIEGESVMGIDGQANRVMSVESVVQPVVKVTREWGTVRVSLMHAFVRNQGGYVLAHECGYAEPDGSARVFKMVLNGSHTYRANGFWSLD